MQTYNLPQLIDVGTARLFDGVDDTLYATLDLSSYSTVSLCMWAWIDVTTNANDKMLMEFGNPHGEIAGGMSIYPNYSAANAAQGSFEMEISNGAAAYGDYFARPSAQAWHHYIFGFNRSTPLLYAYVDGTLVSTGGIHAGSGFGNFINTTFSLFARNGSSLFLAGRVCDVAIYGGVALGSTEALLMAAGRRANKARQSNLIAYWPMAQGTTTEPDHSGTHNVALTVAGTRLVAGPPGLDPFSDDSDTIRSATSFSISDVDERVDSATIGSVTTFSAAEVYTPAIGTLYTDAATITSVTTPSVVEGVERLDSGTFSSVTAFSGVDVAIRVDAATINPRGTLSGTESRVVTDIATFNPITAFTGLDHLCIYVPNFVVSAQTEFDVEEGNARTNYHLGVQKRFYVTAELSPGSNPC